MVSKRGGEPLSPTEGSPCPRLNLILCLGDGRWSDAGLVLYWEGAVLRWRARIQSWIIVSIYRPMEIFVDLWRYMQVHDNV